MQNTSEKFWKRMASVILCVSIGVMGMVCQAAADEKASVVQSVIKDDNICLFIHGLDEYDNVSGQVGRQSVEIVSSGTDSVIHTIILLDNSLSVTKDSMGKVKEILRQYAEKKSENEKISLAVYGTDIQYLTEEETDSAKLMEALENVVNEDKDTYLTDVLYDELQKLTEKTEYTRFLVITDGVDNKAIGYTKEELADYLKENAYPVYSIGCTYKNNEEQLKNLFAISRLTKAGYYLLDDYEEYGEIVESLCEPVTCVEVRIPDELKDGSVKNILLTFEGAESVIEISEELAMPFGLEEADPVSEPVETPSAEPEPTPAAESTPSPTQEPVMEMPEQEPRIDLVSIVAVVVIGIAMISLLILNFRKKSKTGNVRKQKNRKEEIMKNQVEEEESGHTVLAEPAGDAGATVFLNSRDNAKYIVVLRDKRNPDRVFRYPLSDKVLLGRKYGDGVNIVLNYEGTVSAKHCEISMREEKFYVRDLHSSNGTFVNGTRVGEIMEFTSGSEIRLGNLSMVAEIEQARQ